MMIAPLLTILSELAKQASLPIYIVGGVVRDLLRGQEDLGKDLDIVVVGDALAFARKAEQTLGGTLKEFPQFGTAKLTAVPSLSLPEEIDFITARKEIYSKPGALPGVKPGTLKDDLARRDFTINAMAIEPMALLASLTGSKGSKEIEDVVIDPFGGRRDLKKQLIRILRPDSFEEDPTRIFRAGRYLLRIGGILEEETAHQLATTVSGKGLSSISWTRRYNELKRVCSEPEPVKMLNWLMEKGVLRASLLVLPEREELVVGAASGLSTLLPSPSPQTLYLLWLQLILWGNREEEWEQRAIAFGLGAKIGRAMISVVRAAREAEMDSSAEDMARWLAKNGYIGA